MSNSHDEYANEQVAHDPVDIKDVEADDVEVEDVDIDDLDIDDIEIDDVEIDEAELDEIDIDLAALEADEAPDGLAAAEPDIDLTALAEPTQEAPLEGGDDVEVNLDFTGGSTAEAPADGEIDLNFGAEEEKPAEAEADSGELTDEAQVALAELHDHLRFAPGEWFVVHTYSGMENRVKQNLESRIRHSSKPGTINMEDFIFEVVVPTEQVEEIRGNQKKVVTRVVHPGYVLVRMEMTDESWATVRHTPSVTGFVGHGQDPVPISTEEVEHWLAPWVVSQIAKANGGKGPRKKTPTMEYEIGESVQVDDGGPFTGVHATITEINSQTKRVKVMVEMLGRETPMELTLEQITKIV